MDDMEQLYNWADMYSQAQEDGVFDKAPKPPQANQSGETSFFGVVSNSDPSQELTDEEASGWADVYRQTEENATPFGGVAGEIEVQYEDEDEFSYDEAVGNSKKTKAGDVAKDMLDSPNPVYPTSTGKDQELNVTPNWGTVEDDSVDGLVEVEKIKRNLYDLECKLSGEDGLKESAPDIVKQLDAMKKKLDDLSNKLNPSYWTDRES